MSNGKSGVPPAFSIEAAHEPDRRKEVTYPPRPRAEEPDYQALRQSALSKSRQTRAIIGDDERQH